MAILRTPNDTLQWRQTVPKRLVQRIGRQNLYVALKTNNGTAALRLANIFRLSAQHLFETVEIRNLDSDEACALVDRFYEWSEAAVYRWMGKDLYAEPEIPRAERSQAIANSVIEAIRETSTCSKQHSDALETFFRGALASITAAAEKPVVVNSPTPHTRLPSSAPSLSSDARGRGTATISELLPQFEEEMGYRAKPITIKRYVNHIRLYLILMEDVPIAEVRSTDLYKFINTVSQLPADWGRKYRRRDPDKPLPDIIEENPDAPKIASSTVKSYIISMRMFFDWAETNAYIWRSPARRLKRKTLKTSKEERDELSHDDLVRIFENSPLYVGCENDIHVGTPGSYRVFDHRFWFPLVGLFSGLRINEICILSPNEVRELEGVLCFDLRKRDTVAAKTVFARRIVPVHPELIRIGFAEYVEERRQNRDNTLWPELVKPKSITITMKMSNFWYHHREQIGLSEKNKPFYSIRHTFITGLYRQETKAEVIAELAGHYFYPEFKTRAFQTHRRYIKSALIETLKREIYRLDFGLNLSHLYKE